MILLDGFAVRCGAIGRSAARMARKVEIRSLGGRDHDLEFFELAHPYKMRPRALAEGVEGKGLHIIEVRTNRERNVTLHRDAWQRVAAAVRDL